MMLNNYSKVFYVGLVIGCTIIGYLAYLDLTDNDPPVVSSYKALSLLILLGLFALVLFLKSIATTLSQNENIVNNGSES